MVAILFIALLAGAGWDQLNLSDARRPRRVVAAILLAMGFAIAMAGAWVSSSPDHMTWMLRAMSQTGQVLNELPPADRALASLVAHDQLSLAAAITVLTAGLLGFCGLRRGIGATCLVLVAMGHVIWFAASERVASDASAKFPPAWVAALSQVTADQRVLETSGYLSESGPVNGFFNVGGYNPLVLGRTARFLAATQMVDPQSVGVHLIPQFLPNIYRMLRCVLVTTYLPDGPIEILSSPLPRLSLIGEFRQYPDPDLALAGVVARGFDPARTVVLESRPEPAPQLAAGAGTVHLIKQTTDELEIEADLNAPQLLLVTDAYSDGWQVVPLETGPQTTYHVMAANYCLRAIPLGAGHHHFRLEYRPRAVIVGMWISLVAAGAYIVVSIRLMTARA
jgi:hypothetical protein